MFNFLKYLFRKKKYDVVEYNVIENMVQLILTEAVKNNAQKIVFGIPADNLEKIHFPQKKEENEKENINWDLLFENPDVKAVISGFTKQELLEIEEQSKVAEKELEKISDEVDAFMENMVEEAKNKLIEGSKEKDIVRKLPANKSKELEMGKMPIWYQYDNTWHEQEGLPYHLFPELLMGLEYVFTVDFKNKDFERKYIELPDCLIEAKLLIEKNYCYSIEIIKKH